MRPIAPRFEKLTKLTVTGLVLAAAAGCSRSDPPANESGAAVPAVSIKTSWRSGRDSLCIADQRAGLIVYAAEGNTNCMVRGTSESIDGGFRIRPDGDAACTIDVRADAGALILGEVLPACAYYCGPKASYAGKRLSPNEGGRPVDVAGEPLC